MHDYNTCRNWWGIRASNLQDRYCCILYWIQSYTRRTKRTIINHYIRKKLEKKANGFIQDQAIKTILEIKQKILSKDINAADIEITIASTKERTFRKIEIWKIDKFLTKFSEDK